MKTASLRSMLIPVKEPQLSDTEVVSKFASLRVQILKLVKTAWSHEKKPQADKLSEEQSCVLKPFMDYKIDKRYLGNRIRGVIFAILDEEIFSVKNYPLVGDHARLAEALRNIESFMCENLPRDNHTRIVDWRLTTMKVMATISDDGNDLACAAYHAIQSFFAVFERRAGKEAESVQALEKICKDAVALSLMMRTAKDEYRVDPLASAVGKPVADYMKLAEDEDVQPAISKAQKPDIIAYFITGALVKLPYDNPGDVKVLEKAQAVVYAASDKT
ncbi:unnamed protein product [Discula destructiva]